MPIIISLINRIHTNRSKNKQLFVLYPAKNHYYQPMTTHIKNFDPAREYFFVEGCYINELSNGGLDPDVSIARARVTPGVTTQWHRLNATTERYVILEGTGEVEIGECAPKQVNVGDVVIIPPQTRQRITNTGDSDLIFLAICSPRFHEKNYIDS